uniref:Alpha,alpha-trehalose glucohydrolase n=1 Tax=Globodera rostochiensis TaxID=31243 RepID=A0A914I0W8_GLORO
MLFSYSQHEALKALLIRLHLPSPPFSSTSATATTFYLKTQFKQNEFIAEKDELNCLMNGIDLTALGLEWSCEQWPDLAPIYCDGKIEAVNYWGVRMLFLRDSKHFVGRPLLKDPKKVVEQFKARSNVTEWKQFVVSDMSPAQVHQLGKFVQENFGKADGLLIPHKPEDWKENPHKFEHKDAKLKKWAKEMNQIWKAMSKKMAKYVVMFGRPFLRASLLGFLLDCTWTARIRNDVISAENVQEFAELLVLCRRPELAFITANVQICRGMDELALESKGINFGTQKI